MHRCNFTPYEGKKPYIFISYAHKDSAKVYPILEKLNAHGYRVWYDDGIAPGSEWPENIAQHLSGCALTMAFISPASMASDNCRREVTFALSKRKPFLGIILEPTEMSLGMEMQLSSQQCIMKYSYTTEESFYSKVYSCPDLEPCLEKKKDAPVAAAAGAATTVTAAAAAIPAAEPVKEKKTAKPLDKKMMGIIAGAAAVVILLAVVLAAMLGGGGKNDPTLNNDGTGSTGSSHQKDPSDPSDQTHPSGYTEERSLHYFDQTITSEEIAYISRQTQLGELGFHNCVFQPGTLAQLELAQSVEYVYVQNCSGVDDLSAVSALKNIGYLEITDCDMDDETLPPLASEKLYEVHLSGNAGLTDLSMLSGCSELEIVDFCNTGVTSVELLADKEKLTQVCGSNTDVTDITPLANLTTLVKLEFSDCGIESVDAVFYSLRLETLDLSYNLLDDIDDAFQYCTVLCDVDLSFNELYSVDFLEKSANWLSCLNLSGNDNLFDFNLEFLEGCESMAELRLDAIWLYDLDLVKNMTLLQTLSANDCRISDISGLEDKKLSYLSLYSNKIEDLSPLAGMDTLTKLDLAFNSNLSDLSSLPSHYYEVLNLTYTSADLSTLPAIEGGAFIIHYYDGLLDYADFSDAFGEFYICACALDKVVSVEDAIGKDKVTFANDDLEYVYMLDAVDMEWQYYAFLVSQLS